MKIIDPFPQIPPSLPVDSEQLRILLRLAFEYGDAAGACKAYENVAEQLAGAPGGAPLVVSLRRWSASLRGRARRAKDDLAALGWSNPDSH